MCGIAGIFGFRDDDLIRKFSKKLSHRGPDGEGFYFSREASLLNRRLAIIDRKTGDQPIYNENKSLVIVFNGEIYNYAYLREELLQKGHLFKTNSDTEVIIHAFEQWGETGFDKLNGMFAVALYDIKNKKLYLARDHFGIKPLHFAFLEKDPSNIKSNLPLIKLIFSSEIKPLLYSGLVKIEPNDKIIYRYLKFRIHDEGRETFFKGINRLLPGEILVIDKNRIEYKKYTHLEDKLINSKETKINAENAELFQEKLTTSVKQRLISEVPVGTCLSGGLDSSSIVAIINKLLIDKSSQAKSIGAVQKTFSAVFPQETNDEEKYIDCVIDNSKNIKSYKVYPNVNDFHKDLIDFVRTQEEPTISTGPYAQYLVMNKAKEEVTVLLDGQGADEMLAGYLPYYLVYLRQLIKNHDLYLFFSELFFSKDHLFKLLGDFFKEKIGLTKKLNVTEILRSDFAIKFQNEQFIIKNNSLKKRLIEDIFQNSLPSLLRYEDRNTMHFSLEGRIPFLDFNLLNYVFSLPDQAIIHQGWNKNILRNAMHDFLPEMIVKRRDKIGFTTPENSWFKAMIPDLYQILVSNSFKERKYWEQKKVLNYFWDFINGKSSDTMFFWRLINIEIWLREFFPEIKNGEDIKINFKPKELVTVNKQSFLRRPLKTELFCKGDNLSEKIFQNLIRVNLESIDKKWFLVISEKIVAISQGRSYFIWDIHPTFWATFLSGHVTKTKTGIGLGSPFTMQLAINEVGLFRILIGALISFLTKPFNLKGIFYHVAGKVINQIDGPTEYSLYPSNVSAKLGPKDPDKVVLEIDKYLKDKIKFEVMKNYLGSVIIDANDLGQNILGNSTGMENKIIREIFKDNPMGQGNEQTPLTLVKGV